MGGGAEGVVAIVVMPVRYLLISKNNLLHQPLLLTAQLQFSVKYIPAHFKELNSRLLKYGEIINHKFLMPVLFKLKSKELENSL